jgi:hypothetical protein
MLDELRTEYQQMQDVILTLERRHKGVDAQAGHPTDSRRLPSKHLPTVAETP